MDIASKDKKPVTANNKIAKLESLGYRTSHLSTLEVDELLKRLEVEQPSEDWRSKL
jgi:hypothetical protein